MSKNSSAKTYRVALVAHDAYKSALVDWVGQNIETFALASIYSTGTTGRLLVEKRVDLNVVALKSGPLGGDQ